MFRHFMMLFGVMRIEPNQNEIPEPFVECCNNPDNELCAAEKFIEKFVSQLCREEVECVELVERLREKLEEGADNLQLLLDAADR